MRPDGKLLDGTTEMARCGRCGLWEKTPPDQREQVWAGTCLWYHTRLEREFEYQERNCSDFIEKIPPHGASWHFDHKVKRDNLGDAYQKALQSDRRAMIALGFSVTGLIISLTKMIIG